MKIVAAVMMGMLLSACSGDDAPASAPRAKGTVSEGNVFKPQVDALAKAKAAEKLIQDAAEQQRKDVEAIEQ